MPREIKFRCWHKTLNKFTLPFLCDGDDLNEIFQNVNYEFMQWTGLHDKNGKEIYEGDIIKFTYIDNDKLSQALPVVWDEAGCGFHCSDGTDNRGVDMARDYETISGEVIGNIYEDSHLLENIGVQQKS
jgi:uncharacterized phage protein (TIGR01671 family)